MTMPTPLTIRQLTLLTFLNGAGKEELDPVRIMKGLFLVAQEARPDWLRDEDRYSFEPYNYGPCAFEIYDDLKELGAQGYVLLTQRPSVSWSFYSLTPQGEQAVKEEGRRLQPGLVRYLGQLRQFVTNLSFRALLNAVYDRYPDYAINSVFRRSSGVGVAS